MYNLVLEMLYIFCQGGLYHSICLINILSHWSAVWITWFWILLTGALMSGNLWARCPSFGILVANSFNLFFSHPKYFCLDFAAQLAPLVLSCKYHQSLSSLTLIIITILMYDIIGFTNPMFYLHLRQHYIQWEWWIIW